VAAEAGGAALLNRTAEQAACGGRYKQQSNVLSAGRLSGNGHDIRVASERSMFAFTHRSAASLIHQRIVARGTMAGSRSVPGAKESRIHRAILNCDDHDATLRET